MKINADYMAVMRTGARIERARYRKEIESGIIMSVCLAIGAGLVIVAVLTGGF